MGTSWELRRKLEGYSRERYGNFMGSMVTSWELRGNIEGSHGNVVGTS